MAQSQHRGGWRERRAAGDTGAPTTVARTRHGYDDLDRRKTASGFTGGATAAYDYDVIGNLVSKAEGASSLTLSYPAAGQPRPHAVTGVSGSASRGFVYDGDGNQQRTSRSRCR